MYDLVAIYYGTEKGAADMMDMRMAVLGPQRLCAEYYWQYTERLEK